MAGTFVKAIPIFNRAPVELSVMFDGEKKPIPVGLSSLPEHTVWKAKNQNPIMGSGDPYNPGANGTKYLIVTDDEYGWELPLTKDEWEEHSKRPCREDETIWFKERYENDPKAKLITRGSRLAVAARSRQEAGGIPRGLAEFTAKD
jgi:hypothetical protein